MSIDPAYSRAVSILLTFITPIPSISRRKSRKFHSATTRNACNWLNIVMYLSMKLLFRGQMTITCAGVGARLSQLSFMKEGILFLRNGTRYIRSRMPLTTIQEHSFRQQPAHCLLCDNFSRKMNTTRKFHEKNIRRKI